MRAGLGVALVGLVACVGCGPPKPTQDEVIAALKKLGGRVRVDENNDVVWLDLNIIRSKVTDAGLVHLKGLTKLEWLDLTNTMITDAGLVHLKGLTNLQQLHLCDTKVTDAGLVHLKGLENLQYLSLTTTEVAGAGLVHLKGLKKLERLDLSLVSTITPAGVRKLQQALPRCDINKPLF